MEGQLLAGYVKKGDEQDEEGWISIQSTGGEDDGDTELALQRHLQMPDSPDGEG